MIRENHKTTKKMLKADSFIFQNINTSVREAHSICYLKLLLIIRGSQFDRRKQVTLTLLWRFAQLSFIKYENHFELMLLAPTIYLPWDDTLNL